jgi:hypothetical protein
MSTTFTGVDARREIQNRLWEAIEEAGSMEALAAKWGINSSYLSHVWRKKTPPGPSILVPLGLSHMADVATESHPLTTGDVAKMFGVTIHRVTKWCAAGDLQCSRHPGFRSKLRFSPQDVAAYARKRGRLDVVAKIEGREAL